MRYKTIVADPPWMFQVWNRDTGHGRSAESHYPTMSTEDIGALPISSVAEDDCVLLLWSTWPHLPDALQTGIAWGFEYKTLGFIWIKRTVTGQAWHTGMGYWSRANSEPCLLFTRGNPKRDSAAIHQLIVSDETAPLLPGFEETLVNRVGRHSQKPEAFYKRVTELVPGPYLELFSRQPRHGWDVMGNEVSGLDICEELQHDK